MRSSGQAAVSAWKRPQSLYGCYGKRILDLAVAGAALPVLSLLTVGVGLAIKLDDGGPIFFRQERWGREGQPFRIYKFRSMTVGAPDLRNADSSTVAVRGDTRVTRVGRVLRATSLDEVPQFINVLAGSMSLVGPRPNLATKPVAEMTGDELRRLAVKPGITGYNQAYFRNSSTLADRYAADCYYSNHVSLGLDLRILLQTLKTVLARQDVYSSESTKHDQP